MVLIVAGVFIAVLNWFLIERAKEGGVLIHISQSDENANNVSNLPKPILSQSTTTSEPVDFSRSSIDLGDGRSVVAKLDPLATTTEDINSWNYTSRLSIVDSNGAVIKEIYRYKDLMTYLKIHKLSSDKNRLYFYARPDGIGGYYAFDQIFSKRFFEYNFKTDEVREIIVKNSLKLKMQQIGDVSDDGNIVAFTREKTSLSKNASSTIVVSVYYVKENKTFDLPNLEKEGYTIAGGARFVGNNKITYFTAMNNPDNESVATLEYDFTSKTVLKI